jgi:hypothetical protein
MSIYRDLGVSAVSMERADWLPAGFDAAEAPFLMLSDITLAAQFRHRRTCLWVIPPTQPHRKKR